MSETAGAEKWAERWQVLLRCRDCGAEFECEHPNVGLNLVHEFHRLVLIGGRETCPECKNLQVVPPR